MNDTLIKIQNNLLQIAEAELTESNLLLDNFAEDWKQGTNLLFDNFENIRTMQLVLQYRLDTQNALSQLGSLQQYLLQLLGIEPLHSSELNIERISYALGSEDLHLILSMLNKLVDALLRIICSNEKHQILDKKNAMERKKRIKHIDVMSKVIEKQKSFMSRINELKMALDEIGGAPNPGIIYDHIIALQGPISRFYQALQHGLAVSAKVYHQMQLKPHMEHQLADTLQNIDQLIDTLHHQPIHQRLFTPSLENTDATRLEERAAAKRLGHFFGR